MNCAQIPIITVSYNSPDLIETLLKSLRSFYSNRVFVVDGSAPDIVDEIRSIAAAHSDVEFIPFGYNIHHGPGMAWAIRNLGLSGPVLFLDSDVEILHAGLIEDLFARLTPDLYGVGWITEPTLTDGNIQPSRFPYLSPLCMLCNIDVMRQWPLPIKHGAPMITPMLALAQAEKTHLLRHVDWIENDCTRDSVKLYMRHDWQGTVRRTSGYHYDAPPVVAETINPDILALIPTEARTVIEIGCGSGALARAYKKINPVCEWTGVEVDASRVAIARQPCDFVFHADIDSADDTIFSQMTYADCLVISLHIEKLANPWALLSRLRAAIPDHACLIVYFANMQHWSVQARLNQGLLDHSASSIDRRPQWWFTRSTMLSLLAATGFQVSAGSVKIGSADGAQYMPAIRHMATLSGIDPEVAAQDASAVQYIVRAVPIAA